MTPTNKIEEMVRDFCSVTPNIKSEVRRRIYEALAEEKERVEKSVNDILDRYVVKKEPLCEQNSLILLIRAHLLSSLDKLTDK